MTDHRIQHTREQLRKALASLIREKAYDRISVTEILARAGVSRSTFYAHFRDKDELLSSGIKTMLGVPDGSTRAKSPWPENVLWFSRSILEHHASHRAADRALWPKRSGMLHEHLQHTIAGLIVTTMRRHAPTGALPADLLAQHVASTFVLVLNWWVSSKSRLSAEQADAVFRDLVLPALTR